MNEHLVRGASNAAGAWGGELYCRGVVMSPDSNAEVAGSIPKLGKMALFFATSGGSIFLGL